ncbi:Hypothetical protein Y17_0771 [Pectobacterium wasabiae CFBP 3304]|nr:hypothetical protein A7983_19155 [Pectobacterium wasabiae CFBP 3304]EJS95796.1 Hypothetical protein Y17_0771 [Pectobacterium wasabiae CFBP 3304]
MAVPELMQEMVATEVMPVQEITHREEMVGMVEKMGQTAGMAAKVEMEITRQEEMEAMAGMGIMQMVAPAEQEAAEAILLVATAVMAEITLHNESTHR